MSDIIVGIDIGSSKVSTVIGKVIADGQVEFLGKGTEPCTGVKKGIIIDINATAASIQSSVKKAEAGTGIKVVSAYVNMSGLHLYIKNQIIDTNIVSDDKIVSKKDVEKLLYSASSIAIGQDSEIIDVVPKQYILDGFDGIVNPVGMKGSTLQGDFDVVVGKVMSVQNIVRSMSKAAIKVDGLVADSFAVGECVLQPDEKDIGVILIDVGGGSTEISVFKNQKLIANKCFPVGGDHITNDLSIALKMSYIEAERVKRQYQLALTTLIKNDQEITVSDISDSFKKNIKVSEAVEIIEARVYEMLSMCKEFVDKNCPGNYGAGVVISGSGISTLDGSLQIAYDIFNMPVRTAAPKIRDLNKPEFYTAAGIVKYISIQDRGSSTISSQPATIATKTKKENTLFKKAFAKFKDLFY